jgi:hypothetical protein
MHTPSADMIGTRRRRRSSASEPLRKISLQISESVYEAVRSLVTAGEAASTNVFFEEAVRARLRERRKAKVYAAYAQAARDPAFMRDMNADLEAFDVTLSDGLAPAR